MYSEWPAKDIVKDLRMGMLLGKNSAIIVSIIIPTFNGGRYLGNAIKSMASQNLPAENYEILIVDNGSTDNTKEISMDAVKSNPNHNIKYIFESVPGLLSGRHRGALEANGEILVFIDDDIIADQNWLKAIYVTFHDPSVMLVGGKSLPKYEIEPPEWLECFWYRKSPVNICSPLSLLDYGDEVREIDANYVWGLNFSIRKSALFDLDGFHPDTVPRQIQRYQGDGEAGLTIKAKAKGYKTIYQPRALVYHEIPPRRMTYEYFENRNFFQGVASSYAYFRRKYGKYEPITDIKTMIRSRIPEPIKKPLRFVKNLLFEPFYHSIPEQSQREKELKDRFKQAYKKGYEFHQKAVKDSPELLEWVLRDNYWDYKLPDLNGNNSGRYDRPY